MYQVAYVIVKSAISPRPANWILERSIDGISYQPWQFYAQNDEECWTRYSVPPTRGKPSFKSDSEVICTSYYSKLNPLEGGEVHTSLIIGRPGANESTAELLRFTLARYVRLRLQKIRTLNAEFMSLSLDDASMTQRLFYSIKDISIGGQCVCSGHAAKCTDNNKDGKPQCECQHNTCGKSCEKCCPLHNQSPWKPGTLRDNGQCEPCECHGHATSCYYDEDIALRRLSLDIAGQYRGGGVCQQCSAHTTGTNCERCKLRWYRPHDVSAYDEEPCVPCNCQEDTSTGSCSPHITGRLCECKTGFAGSECDECAPGFRYFPTCEPCPCDSRGTQPVSCDDSCVCKTNVEGHYCDRCKLGFFALDEKDSNGCTPCYCSGISHICQQADLHIQNIEEMNDWLVSDLSVTRTILPSIDFEFGQLTIGNYLLPAVENYYWLAPEKYIGNKLASYGSNLTFTVSWVVMRGDTSGKPTRAPNVIIVGSNGLRLASGNSLYHKHEHKISVQLHESEWYILPDGIKDIPSYHNNEYIGERASRTDMMSVLTNVKYILLRAKFHTDQVEGSLWSATLETGSKNGSGISTQHVEMCLCPPGYSGLSCESCLYGYTQVASLSNVQQKECIKCDCNGHAATCDPVTGQCGPCEHNTVGSRCESCAIGYYGNATNGTPSDCKRCACPLLYSDNNFSSECEDDGEGSYICTDCPMGYTGDHCEMCDDGFYGNPSEPGSTCQHCECNAGPCDRLTGQCLSCRGNTEGWHCERCKQGYYGNPVHVDCKPCLCSEFGSTSPDACEPETGQCHCKQRYVGRTCDHCQPGYGNVTAGCIPCSCDPVGSVSDICDSVTGQCDCHPGIGEEHCNSCKHLYYGFSTEGCHSE